MFTQLFNSAPDGTETYDIINIVCDLSNPIVTFLGSKSAAMPGPMRWYEVIRLGGENAS
jgi:hypothetical protein